MADANSNGDMEPPPAKRARPDGNPPVADLKAQESEVKSQLRKGVAPIKPEYIIPHSQNLRSLPDDDQSEAAKFVPAKNTMSSRDNYKQNRARNKENRGQNKNRTRGAPAERQQLCASRALSNEFQTEACPFGEKCRFEHDLRKYLNDKSRDLTTFGGKCPVFELWGFCPVGWKCRFVGSHSDEVVREDLDGKKELVLVIDHERFKEDKNATKEEMGAYNVVDRTVKFDLNRKRIALDRSDAYSKWLQEVFEAEEDAKRCKAASRQRDELSSLSDIDEAKPDEQSQINDAINLVDATGGVEVKDIGSIYIKPKGDALANPKEDVELETPAQDSEPKKSVNEEDNETKSQDVDNTKMEREEERASYIEPPFRAAEKRRLYYGPETPILAPLTTQGNLPFRRLCVKLGAQVTFSEMALGLPLVQGATPEWALMKAHESEITPPLVSGTASTVVPGYDNSKDIKFGVQIAAGKPWIAFKATEVIAMNCPHVRAIDLNAGCPIDLVFKQGAGSALLDNQSRLEKILRGMNALSGEIPITLKIRMGTKDNTPTADGLVKRVLFGGRNAQVAGLGPTGVAAITLHGRSRQQRYTRLADWEYISDIAALIRAINRGIADKTDTAAAPDPRDLPNGGKVLFVGNGDILSHEDYQTHVQNDLVDSAMIGRGALVKPWIFEEIAAGQHLDKSATERLDYVADFVRYGLDAWGADERGVGTTRRFLLEWLSFAHRYVPVGLLERLPPRINERPPPFRGRDEVETLLASDNYRDWVKISEMYLGPADRSFKFVPKHKSNSYDIQAEG